MAQDLRSRTCVFSCSALCPEHSQDRTFHTNRQHSLSSKKKSARAIFVSCTNQPCVFAEKQQSPSSRRICTCDLSVLHPPILCVCQTCRTSLVAPERAGHEGCTRVVKIRQIAARQQRRAATAAVQQRSSGREEPRPSRQQHSRAAAANCSGGSLCGNLAAAGNFGRSLASRRDGRKC